MKNIISSLIQTPLGPLLAQATNNHIINLHFVDTVYGKKWHPSFVAHASAVIDQLKKELDRYFSGSLRSFTTPILLSGTPFQMRVWEELSKIPIGQTRSYSDIAKAIDNPRGYRAVAQANAANPLAIIIGCHRVINSSGKVGGYAGGSNRKNWLLNHEQTVRLLA